MQFSTRPVDEVRRLAALEDLQILDTDFEPAYDDIVRRAAEICGVAIANISMIDRDRQWHKAMTVAMPRDTPRDITFCAHTILYDGLHVIEDVALDPRFRDNPFVAGEPHVRFYAGHPLFAPGGEAVGTLCVVGQEPKVLTAEQRSALQELAQQAMTLLDLRARALRARQGGA